MTKNKMMKKIRQRNIVLFVHVRDRKLYHQLEAADGREQWKEKKNELRWNRINTNILIYDRSTCEHTSYTL